MEKLKLKEQNMKPIIIIYHSILGIRDSENNLADVIRKAGFEVIIPDLFDGKVFNDYDSAMKHLDTLGAGELSTFLLGADLSTPGVMG